MMKIPNNQLDKTTLKFYIFSIGFSHVMKRCIFSYKFII